jgi:hypothetical protein
MLVNGHTSLCYSFLSTLVSAYQYIPLHGCIISVETCSLTEAGGNAHVRGQQWCIAVVHDGTVMTRLSTLCKCQPGDHVTTHDLHSTVMSMQCMVTSGLQSMAMKATSPLYLAAQRLTISRLLYSLVFITMYHKVSLYQHLGPRTLQYTMLEVFLLGPDLMDQPKQFQN